MSVSTALWALVGGTLIGLLGPWSGRVRRPAGVEVDVPVWLTAPAGMVGVWLGNQAYGIRFGANTPGLDWWRHGWQLTVAFVLVLIVARATARRG